VSKVENQGREDWNDGIMEEWKNQKTGEFRRE
jgi:hypothetical protein